jgi:hypothetical protein
MMYLGQVIMVMVMAALQFFNTQKKYLRGEIRGTVRNGEENEYGTAPRQ